MLVKKTMINYMDTPTFVGNDYDYKERFFKAGSREVKKEGANDITC